MIRRGVTSPEHEAVIKFISHKWDLKIVQVQGGYASKGKYFPDATSKDADYEVKVVPRKNYLEKKVIKWDKSRKKVLILKPNSFALDNFDEIYVYSKGELIKIK